MLKDIYFSQSLFESLTDMDNGFDEHDEKMALININGKYVPFSEQITHGKEPYVKRDDLILIATIPQDEIDIKVVNLSEFYLKN